MPDLTYYVALPFMRSKEDGSIVSGEPKEARSAYQAIRLASGMANEAGHCGAVAYSRTGDPATGEYADAVILKVFGEV